VSNAEVWILGEPLPGLDAKTHGTMLTSAQTRTAADLWDSAQTRTMTDEGTIEMQYKRVLVRAFCSEPNHGTSGRKLLGQVVFTNQGPLLVIKAPLDRHQRHSLSRANGANVAEEAASYQSDMLTWPPGSYEAWSPLVHFHCRDHGLRCIARSALIVEARDATKGAGNTRTITV
jgi:hypothetical protein